MNNIDKLELIKNKYVKTLDIINDDFTKSIFYYANKNNNINNKYFTILKSSIFEKDNFTFEVLCVRKESLDTQLNENYMFDIKNNYDFISYFIINCDDTTISNLMLKKYDNERQALNQYLKLYDLIENNEVSYILDLLL